jgi:hypothetical protein
MHGTHYRLSAKPHIRNKVKRPAPFAEPYVQGSVLLGTVGTVGTECVYGHLKASPWSLC